MKGTIVYYGGFDLPDKNAAANRVVSNSKLFDSLGYKTVLLGADYSADGRSELTAISQTMLKEPHPYSTFQWIKNLLFFKNLKNLVNGLENVKLVILYNMPFITLCLARIYFKSRNIEVAYDCTEWTTYTVGSLPKKLFKFIDYFFIRFFAHKVANRMIVISKKMEEAYSGSKKLMRLPPLVDTVDDIWHQIPENKADDFVFCFAGFPDGNKDRLDLVVRAFEECSMDNARLRVLGVTKEEFRKIYPELKQEVDSVEFLGSCSHRAAIRHMLGCDCYIFIRESSVRNNAGFPTKFVESYTCAASIITTRTSDIGDYLSDKQGCILLDATRNEDIKNAMQKLYRKRAQRVSPALSNTFDYRNYTDQAKSWLS